MAMDADLSRGAAQMFNSPLWRWVLLRFGGKFSDRAQSYRQQIDRILLRSGTIAGLPDELRDFLKKAIQSYELDEQMFGGKGAEFLEDDELNAIASELDEPFFVVEGV